MQSHINVGYGSDITIGQVAKTIAKVIGFSGAIDFDPSKPDGSPKKLMDSARINALGWHAKVNLEAGLSAAYADFLSNAS
jgi:GDP-L-fucose synthase